MFASIVHTLFYEETVGDSPDAGGLSNTQPLNKVAEGIASAKPLIPQNFIANEFYTYLLDINVLPPGVVDGLSQSVHHRVSTVLSQPASLLQVLPAMPVSVNRVIDLLQDREFSIDILLPIIEKEPAMATELIKLANSARYFRGNKPVTDLRTAFMFMGSQGLMDGVLEVFLKQFSAMPTYHFHMFGQRLWQHCYQTGLYAQRMVNCQCGPEKEGEAFFVGLIRHLGTMLLFRLLLESFNFMQNSVEPNVKAFDYMLERYSLQLTIDIAKHWQLPASIITALTQQTEECSERSDLAECVFYAEWLSEQEILLSAGIQSEQDFLHKASTLPKSKGIETIVSEIFATFSDKNLDTRP